MEAEGREGGWGPEGVRVRYGRRGSGDEKEVIRAEDQTEGPGELVGDGGRDTSRETGGFVPQSEPGKERGRVG